MDIHKKIKDLESLPDEALIERYNRNITEAADILYSRHHQTIRLIVSQKIPVKEDCEDLVQEIFCRILSKLKEQYAESGRFSGWIRTITYHFISEYYRKQKRLPVMTTEIPDNLERDIPPDESLLRSLESVYAEMSKRINELQPKDQELLTLRFYRQKTFKEISDEMGMKKPTCVKRISSLCIKLNQELQEQGIHELPEILK